MAKCWICKVSNGKVSVGRPYTQWLHLIKDDVEKRGGTAGWSVMDNFSTTKRKDSSLWIKTHERGVGRRWLTWQSRSRRFSVFSLVESVNTFRQIEQIISSTRSRLTTKSKQVAQILSCRASMITRSGRFDRFWIWKHPPLLSEHYWEESRKHSIHTIFSLSSMVVPQCHSCWSQALKLSEGHWMINIKFYTNQSWVSCFILFNWFKRS